ncbi:MAG: hypothetical protein P0120_23440 [Nitrospira sp.]|nr:hypothetical protein [Nitrospira sp.]
MERLVQTFQDRLIKEMRLAGIATLEDANRFVEHYLPVYNRRFAVAPAQPANLHRPAPSARELARSLCIKSSRCLRKDVTITHEGQLYQVHDHLRATHVVVEEHLDGTRRLTHQGRLLSFHAIPARPVPAAAGTTVSRSRRPIKPAADHPGASDGSRNEDHTRQQPEHKTGHFYCGRKRTFLFGLDSGLSSIYLFSSVVSGNIRSVYTFVHK